MSDQPKAPGADAVRDRLKLAKYNILERKPITAIYHIEEVLAALSPAPGADREAVLPTFTAWPPSCHPSAYWVVGRRTDSAGNYSAECSECGTTKFIGSPAPALAAQPVVGDADALEEWRAAREDCNGMALLGAEKAETPEHRAIREAKWKRLGHAEHRLMDVARAALLSRQSVQGEEDSIGHRDSRGSTTR